MVPMYCEEKAATRGSRSVLATSQQVTWARFRPPFVLQVRDVCSCLSLKRLSFLPQACEEIHIQALTAHVSGDLEVAQLLYETVNA